MVDIGLLVLFPYFFVVLNVSLIIFKEEKIEKYFISHGLEYKHVFLFSQDIEYNLYSLVEMDHIKFRERIKLKN